MTSNLTVAHDGLLCVTEIVHIFHTAAGYLDYRGAFQTVIDM